MSNEKRSNNNENTNVRENSSTNKSDQQNERTKNNQYESKSGQTQQDSGMSASKLEVNPSHSENPKNSSGKKDVDSERHPEEQVVEYKKDDQKLSDKSVRV